MRGFPKGLFGSRELRDSNSSLFARRKNNKDTITNHTQSTFASDISADNSNGVEMFISNQSVLYQSLDDYVGSIHAEQQAKTMYTSIGKLRKTNRSPKPMKALTQNGEGTPKTIIDSLTRCLEPLQCAKNISVSLRPCFKVQHFKKTNHLQNPCGSTTTNEIEVVVRSVDDDPYTSEALCKNGLSMGQTEEESSTASDEMEGKVRVQVPKPIVITRIS